jgi:hypothetical protein
VGPEKARQVSPTNRKDVPQDSEWFRFPETAESDKIDRCTSLMLEDLSTNN